jgi:alcohol dehydrogenase (cytochrome c)
LDTLIWGIGNPAPDFDNAYRPGDNLYTNSVLGMNPGTGKINWYFQYTPNDAWDFDEVGTHLLIDATIDGQPRKAMAHSARNGFYYFLDRTNGSFINGAVYSKDVNWTTGLDPKTGKPLSYDPTKKVQNYVAGTIASNQTPQAKVCPNIGGGNNYFPSAYSPKTNLFYAIGNESCSDIKKTTFEPGKFKLRDPVGFGNVTWGGRHTSSITAISVATGKMVKRMDYPYSNYGGLLSTAGGILVTGYLDGSFVVNDDTSLEELFTIYLGSPINAPPITYSVGGKQYLAILVGVGPIAKGRNTNSPEIKNLNSTSMLYAFTL